MGSIISRIYDDEKDYEYLCEKYGEQPNGGPYGEHAKQLEARAKKEREEEKKQPAKEGPASRFDRIEPSVPKEVTPSEMPSVLHRRDPSDIRAQGWMVAVHNDYKLNGVDHTFWLFTNREGKYVKGEGFTDEEALDKVREQLKAMGK